MLGRTATRPSKLRLGTISALALCGQIGLAQAQEPTPLPVKVVVVTMFELGEDTGDRPGEFQAWVERLPLPERVPLPQGHRDLRYDPEKDVMASGTRRNGPSEADPDVPAKLAEQRLERGEEPEALPGRQIMAEDDLLQLGAAESLAEN